MQNYFGINPPEPGVVDPITGIVTFIAEGEKLRADPDVFVVAAQSSMVTNLHDVKNLSKKSHQVQGSGAGLTYNDALNAAVGETVERYAFGIVHPEDLVLSTYKDLINEGKKVLHPSRWALFHSSQNNQVPYSLFEENTLIAWVKADHLVKKSEYYVPACLVYSPYFGLFLDQGEEILAPAISTGSACAFDRQEAVLKGICEVIERDAFMILWRNQLPVPEVKIDPKSDIYDIFQKKINREGLEFHLFYTTFDLGIPSFFGVLINHRHSRPSVLVGGACHPDPNRAALKTLLELSQGLQWSNHVGNQEVIPNDDFSNIRSFDDRMYLYAFGNQIKNFEFLLSSKQKINLSDIENINQPTIKQNIELCINRMQEEDINVLAIELTTNDVAECGLHVTKVLLPECVSMEGDHTMPFLGGRRWQDVPVKMGYKPHATKIDEINTNPHPYP